MVLKRRRGVLLEGTVFLDANGNGKREADEKPLENIKISLYRMAKTDAQEVTGNSRHVTTYRQSEIAAVHTDHKGEYRFLAYEGSYRLGIDPSTLPEGYKATAEELAISPEFYGPADFAVVEAQSSKLMPGQTSSDRDDRQEAGDERKKITRFLYSIFDRRKLQERSNQALPVKNATTLLKEVLDYVSREDADHEIVRLAERYLATPVPSLDKVYTSPGGFFKIHYTLKGPHSVSNANAGYDGVPRYIKATGAAFERAKAITCDERGFLNPLTQQDKKWIDVYVFDQKGKYGVSIPSDVLPGEKGGPRKARAYICIDNNYAREKGFQKSKDDCMRATAAHEFFHVVQYAYNYDADSWWKEATATWNENEMFPENNDYLQYLKSALNDPGRPLERSSYSGVVFAKFLTENLGGHWIIRRTWELQGSSRTSIQAIDRAIRESQPGEDLGSAFARYAAYNYNPEQYYKDGHLWASLVTVNSSHSNYPAADEKKQLDHLAASYELFRPGNLAPGQTLKVVLKGTDNGKLTYRLQKRRKSDGLCELAEISFKASTGRAEIQCGGLGEEYSEVCLIPVNRDLHADGLPFSYSAELI